jgi:hypothetical protein
MGLGLDGGVRSAGAIVSLAQASVTFGGDGAVIQCA